MIMKNKAIYEPGELGQVRDRLGEIDVDEARRVARILGGEVGTEKTAADRRPWQENVELSMGGRRKKGRPIDLPDDFDDDDGRPRRKARQPKADPLDDPLAAVPLSYFERIRMDRFASLPDFEIKGSAQMLSTFLPFSKNRGDYINPRFTRRRMPECYAKIEKLVVATRTLLPRNNARRGEKLKRAAPYVYSILDTIRQWNIERIGGDLAKMQARPRSVRTVEYADMMRAVYKPMFILEELDADIHVKGSYKILCRLLVTERPSIPKAKMQELVRTALAAYFDVMRNVHYRLHPLLMKFISERWFPYDRLFLVRPRRYMAFLGVTEDDRIRPEAMHIGEINFDGDGRTDAAESEAGKESGEPVEDERKVREAAAESRAMEQSVKAMESLFPKAGWERLESRPDLYPYFVSIYGLRRGYELIATDDPLQQVAVLMHIIEDLCSAFRYVNFEPVIGPDGNDLMIGDLISRITGNWRRYIDESFAKEYLPRLSEYCRMLGQSRESGTSPFAKRILNDLRWVRRLYFLPYYKFDSMGPPSFQKREIQAVYSEVRMFRKYLTIVAAGIEKWSRAGGAAAKLRCEGIENPTARYKFDIANPVSKRMDLMLPLGQRNNVRLIFFMLSAVTVLDCLLNSETSWAYEKQSPSGYLFRTAEGKGGVPVFGVEEKIDADHIFRDSLRKARARQQAARK